MKGESRPAYDAFLHYRDQGTGRSKLAVTRWIRKRHGKPDDRHPSSETTGKRLDSRDGTVARWAKSYNWDYRAEAYDDFVNAARTRGLTKAIESDEARKVRLRKQHEEAAVAIADKCLLRAIEMLDWPLKQETQETTRIEADPTGTLGPDGKPIYVVIKQKVTIEPVRWRLRDAASLLKVAHEIKGQVFGEPPPPPPPAPVQTPDILEHAARLVAAYRERADADLRRRLALPAPNGHPSSPASESDCPESEDGNGNGGR